MSLGPGMSMVGDALQVSAGPVVVLQEGIGLDAVGAVVVTAVLPSPLFYVDSIPVDGTGVVFVVDKAVAVPPLQQQQSGLQFDASGALVTVDVGSAVAPLAGVGRLSCDASGALVTSA